MRLAVLAAVVLTVWNVAPAAAEDAFIQPRNLPASARAETTADAPTYDECFQLGWVRGVHVERGEWDDFYSQCRQGEVPFASGMNVDSVPLDHRHAVP
ncbi:hypothetical protein [Undibacter mobilis]|nr:hypothetical protein [Undibacter mobilis]